MTKPRKPVAVIAVQAPGSKVWHLQEHFKMERFSTICGKPFDDWTVEFGVQDDQRICKKCLRKLEAALGRNYRITDVSD